LRLHKKREIAAGFAPFKFRAPDPELRSECYTCDMNLTDEPQQPYPDSLPTDYISGADTDGIYVGKLVTSKNRLMFTYSARAKDLLVLTLDLTKK
jgi:hypothetical protein